MSMQYASSRPGLDKAKDRLAAICLMNLMSEISESYYCSGWLHDLEFSLYSMLLGGSRTFGFSEVQESEIAMLKDLSETSGGWWMWVGDGEVFVTTEEWKVEYAKQPVSRDLFRVIKGGKEIDKLP